MTDIAPIDWEARLRNAVAETLRVRAERRRERAELAERRAHGLTQRHRRKLARRATPAPGDVPSRSDNE